MTYCCSPGEIQPTCVLVTVFKQGYYYTSVIMEVVRVMDICTTFGQWVTLNDTGDDYSFNFRICGGSPTMNYAGPCVVEDKDTDCPCD